MRTLRFAKWHIIVAAFAFTIAVVAMTSLLLFGKRALPPPLALVVGVRSVHVFGSAMAPTLQDGQFLLVDTRAYAEGRPQRGDIVVFNAPGRSVLFIERVIAVPGDRLRISEGTVFINGTAVSEPYLSGRWTYNKSWPIDGREVVVHPDYYFLMGDNRDHSDDSRFFGFIGRSAIQGKALP